MSDERQVLPLDAVEKIRHPKELFTDAYLNDPIQFAPDSRFDPISAIQQITDTPMVGRDLGEYMVVDTNSKTALAFPIPMYSKSLNRADFMRVIDRKFRFFPTK